MDWNELLLEPRQLGLPSSASKMISDPMVRLAQAVHLTCSHTNTVTERTETRLHMCHITLEFHRRHPKRFLSLWYVRRKPCTNLALILTPSTNRPKRDLTWPTSPRSLWYVQRKQCTYLESRLSLFPNGMKRASTWASSPRRTVRCMQNDFYTYGTFTQTMQHYLQMGRNELPLEPSHLEVPLGASKMISGTFSTNCAPIMLWH
jgi:hypothetical protein